MRTTFNAIMGGAHGTPYKPDNRLARVATKATPSLIHNIIPLL